MLKTHGRKSIREILMTWSENMFFLCWTIKLTLSITWNIPTNNIHWHEKVIEIDIWCNKRVIQKSLQKDKSFIFNIMFVKSSYQKRGWKCPGPVTRSTITALFWWVLNMWAPISTVARLLYLTARKRIRSKFTSTKLFRGIFNMLIAWNGRPT